MLEEKSEFVASIPIGEHRLVVYDSPGERDALVDLFIGGALRRKDFIAIYSEDNAHLLRFLTRGKKGVLREALARKDFLVFDADEVFGKGQPPSLSAFERTFIRAINESLAKKKRLSWLGEFPIKFLGRFDVESEIERLEICKQSREKPTILCLKRRDAMCTLEPKEVFSLYVSHDSILLSDTALSKANATVHYAGL